MTQRSRANERHRRVETMRLAFTQHRVWSFVAYWKRPREEQMTLPSFAVIITNG
jgi:hypothetical protein